MSVSNYTDIGITKSQITSKGGGLTVSGSANQGYATPNGSSGNWYVQGVAERGGIAIDLNISKDFGRLPAEMELAIFRVVQECLTNIHRHAESKTAYIRVAREKAHVQIEIRDEGKGISSERLAEIRRQGSGVGIGGM